MAFCARKVGTARTGETAARAAALDARTRLEFEEAEQSGRSLGDEDTFRPRIERINPVLGAESSLAALAQSPPLSSFWHADPRCRPVT